MEEGGPLTQQKALQHSPAQQLADDVALLFVPRSALFMDAESDRPHVVGDAAEGTTVRGGVRVILADNVPRGDTNRAKNIVLEIAVDPLQDGRGPLETHPGVDVFLGERLQVVGRGADAVELREDQVPDFHARFGPRGVVVDFTAGAADPVGPLAGGAGWPEILALPLAADVAGGNSDLVVPDLVGLIVVEVDGDVESVFGQAEPLGGGQKLPSPVYGLFFEVVSEREVPQHLEKGVVVGGDPNVVDVAGPQALLAGGGLGELELADPQELVLELVHPGGGEQHGGVPAGNEYITGLANTPLGFKEGQVLFAQFVGFHRQ